MFAITNVHLIPVVGDEIESATLLTQDGKILDFGPRDQIEIPKKCEVVDGERQLLMPGFVDSHTHLGLTETGGMGAHYNEMCAPVTPFVNARDGLVPDEEFMYRAHQRAGITTVLTTPGSANVIAGISIAIKTKPTVDVDEIILKNPCHLKMALGENPVRIYGGRGQAPASKMGVAAMIRKKLTAARQYLRKKDRHYEDPEKDNQDFEQDLEMEVLGGLLRREINAEIHAHNYEDMLTAIRLRNEFGFRMHIVHGTEAFKVIDQLKANQVAITFSPQLSVAKKHENRLKSLKSPAMMANAGLLFAISSDHPVYPLDLLPLDAALSMKEGLTLQQATEAISINGAKIMGVDGRVGSIEVGKDADLVLWDQHPILNTQARVQKVWIDGQLLFEGEPSKRQFDYYVESFRS